jgi:hypothetical protein
VEIDQQFVFGSLAANARIEVHHLLIVALHEIDLDTFDTPLFELRE